MGSSDLVLVFIKKLFPFLKERVMQRLDTRAINRQSLSVRLS